MIQLYEDQDWLPRGAEANASVFRDALAAGKGAAGFFNVVVDADSVVRRVPLAIPYGRDPDRANWDFYASLDVQTIRLYLGLSDQDTALYYGDGGIVVVEFGPKLIVHPDDISRLLVNFHGPARTYPYVSFADAALKKFPTRNVQGQDRSDRRFRDRNRRLARHAFWRHRFSRESKFTPT